MATIAPGGQTATGAEPALRASAGRRRRWLGALLLVLVVVAVALTAAVVGLTLQYWPRRFAHTWTRRESVIFAAGWASVALGQLVGLWLWWRAPRNPTGRWLWLAGVTLGLWFVGGYWPHRWATLLMLAVYAIRPALAMAILGWPTGRPNRGLRRWIVAYGLFFALNFFVVGVFDGPPTVAAWPRSLLAPFSASWVHHTVGSGIVWISTFVPALAVIVVLVRQRRRLPASARSLVTPITIAGVLVAGSDLVTVPINELASGLLYDTVRNQQTVLGVLNLTQNYGQVGIAAVALLVAAGWRRRAVRTGERMLDIELGTATPVAAPSAAVQRLVGDASARVWYRRLADRWIDDRGAPGQPEGPDRLLTPALDEHGEVLAVLDTDARRRPERTLLEVAASTVTVRLANERARAVAANRQAELTALQHALLDATDAARRRLERDLHDGAQQRLVGMALTASLAARRPDDTSRRVLLTELASARDLLLHAVDEIPPAVLAGGLASALHALAATTQVPMVVRTEGDLQGSDPLARTVWFVASEAVANVVKHAGASAVTLDLAVDRSAATLTVVDDGRGGVLTPPVAIARRVAEGCGELTVRSPHHAGTEIAATFWREQPRVLAR